MRLSKRKSTRKYASLSAHARIKSNKSPKILKASGRELKTYNIQCLTQKSCGTTVLDAWSLIDGIELYQNILMHVMIFPFSMGQSWDVVLPTLIYLGYITRFSNTLIINYIKFENLRHELSGIFYLHISENHPKGENRQYYTSLDKPQFSGPTIQIEAK